jgi:hypothetical protein
VKASDKFVRIIVRRPHAYQFLNKDRSVSIPGFVFLDAEGTVIGSAGLDKAEQLVEKMHELAQ